MSRVTLPDDMVAGTPPEWCARYIGIPWELGARGPDRIDCWGLDWMVLVQQFGRDAPSYEGIEWTRHDVASRADAGNSILDKAKLDFDIVAPADALPGDVIVLYIGGHPLHCGIVVAPCWMLHAAEGAETALERFDGLVWRSRIAGFWRLR